MSAAAIRMTAMACTVAAALALAACGEPAPSAPRDVDPVAVRTATAQGIEQGAAIRVPGVVRPAIRAQLSTRQAGTVERVRVVVGEQVAAGQELLAIDARDLVAAHAAALRQREAAREASDQASLNRERFARLHEQDLVAKIRLEEAQLEAERAAGRLQQAEAEVAAVEMNLEYTRLRAPFAGVVSEIIVEEGAFASPGMPVLVLEDRARLEVDAAVQQDRVAGLHIGDRVAIRVNGIGEALSGEVRAVLPAAAPGGAGIRLRMVIDGPVAGLVPGMVAEALLPSPNDGEAEVRVPADALLRKGQLTGVFVVTEDAQGVLRAWLRWVSLAGGPGEDGWVRVQRGLRQGERVVVGEAVNSLADDQAVLPEG